MMKLLSAFVLFPLSLVVQPGASSHQESISTKDPSISAHEDSTGKIARRDAFNSLIRFGDYLYHHNARHQALAIYESAFLVRATSVVGASLSLKDELASPHAFVMYGLALENMFDENTLLNRTISLLEEGKALYPHDRMIRYNLAVYLGKIGAADTEDRALKEYEFLLERDPLDSSSLYNRALILLHKGEWEAAAQSLESAIPLALREYGYAWYEGTPGLIRQHKERLEGVKIQPSRRKHLEDFVERSFPLLSNDPAEALVMEFGVAGGESISIIARHVMKYKPDQVVHGFDSFVGLPESWLHDAAGEYTQEGIVPQSVVPENVHFHPGWFNESLPIFLEDHPGVPVAALHMDADLYSSTKEVLDLLVTRLQPGCTIRFDEYYILRGTAESQNEFDQHEARAWKDTMTRYGIEAEPLDWHGQSVTFVVQKNPFFNTSGDNSQDDNNGLTTPASLVTKNKTCDGNIGCQPELASVHLDTWSQSDS